MKMVALASVCATTAAADFVSCDLDGIPMAFEIDRNQFIAPQALGEPPRRKITTVSMNDTQFTAEPILMGDIRGFWAEGLGGANVMFVVQSDGSAIYSDQRTGQRLTGTCVVQQ